MVRFLRQLQKHHAIPPTLNRQICCHADLAHLHLHLDGGEETRQVQSLYNDHGYEVFMDKLRHGFCGKLSTALVSRTSFQGVVSAWIALAMWGRLEREGSMVL